MKGTNWHKLMATPDEGSKSHFNSQKNFTPLVKQNVLVPPPRDPKSIINKGESSRDN